jgi:hypothetical protein
MFSVPAPRYFFVETFVATFVATFVDVFEADRDSDKVDDKDGLVAADSRKERGPLCPRVPWHSLRIARTRLTWLSALR